MKTIKNKTTDLLNGEAKMTYADLAKACVNQPKQGGFSVIEMKERLNLLDKLEGEEFNLEDAESTLLKKLVSEMKWAMMHTDIVQFVENLTK